MANNRRNIIINVDTGDSAKNLKATDASLEQLEEQLKKNTAALGKMSTAEIKSSSEGKKLLKQNKLINKAIEKNNKALKSSPGIMKGFGKAGKLAFKGIGKAIKGAGIGLLIGVLGALWEAMKQNQKIMDLFSKATAALGIVLNPIVNAISDLVTGIMSGSKEFDALKKVLMSTVTLALTPMKLSFYGIKLGVQEVVLAWNKMKAALGSDEAKKNVEELNKSITQTKKDLGEVATGAVDAATSVADNIGEAVDEAASFGKKAADSVKDAFKNVTDGAADATVAAKNSLELLDGQQEKVKQTYDNLIEKQRQIRDNETLTTEERIAASEEVKRLLEEQEKKELAIVDKKIAAQKIVLAQNPKNIEAQRILGELDNQRLAVQSDITGKMSEQKTSAVALVKEVTKLNGILSGTVLTQEELLDPGINKLITQYAKATTASEQFAIAKKLLSARIKLHAREATKVVEEEYKKQVVAALGDQNKIAAAAQTLANRLATIKKNESGNLARITEEGVTLEKLARWNGQLEMYAELDAQLAAHNKKVDDNRKRSLSDILADFDKEAAAKLALFDLNDAVEAENYENTKKTLDDIRKLKVESWEGTEAERQRLISEARTIDAENRQLDVDNLEEQRLLDLDLLSVDIKTKRDKIEEDRRLGIINAKTEAELLLKLEENKAKKTDAINKASLNSKLSAAQSGLSSMVGILGEETAAGKAAAIAETTISTYLGAQKAYASLAGIPVVGPALGLAAASVAVAGGVANVNKITATETDIKKGKEKTYKFAMGGIVPGSDFSGDRVQANLNSGEFVANQQQKDNLLMAVARGNSVGESFDYERLASLINETKTVLVVDDVTEAQERVEIQERGFNG